MPKIRLSTLPLLSALLLVGALAASAPSAAAQGTASAKPSQDEPLQVGGDVLKPVKVSGDPPRCFRKQTGSIKVKGVVDKEGSFGELTVVKPLNPTDDACVLSTLRTWKFKPATKNGVPVAVRYELTVQRSVTSSLR